MLVLRQPHEIDQRDDIKRQHHGKRTVSLGRAKVTAAAGKTARIKVKLTRKALGKLRKATARGKAKVVLTVRATDAAGNRSAASRRVAVKR